MMTKSTHFTTNPIVYLEAHLNFVHSLALRLTLQCRWYGVDLSSVPGKDRVAPSVSVIPCDCLLNLYPLVDYHVSKWIAILELSLMYEVKRSLLRTNFIYFVVKK